MRLRSRAPHSMPRHGAHPPRHARASERGAVLIIVLWVAFGLVAIALYFAQTSSMNLRAGDERAAAIVAENAILGAARYATSVLAKARYPGQLPDLRDYRFEEVALGDAVFWFLGRGDSGDPQNRPVFGIVDEASRLNLNTATAEMLERLPRMTPELAAAIVDWRDEDSEPGPGGAEDETYLRLEPAYRAKNAPFESLDELNLVHGMTPEILYGEDANLNGVLDANENDGDRSPPLDDANGRLDFGIIEYLTVHSRERTTGTDGAALIDLSQSGIDQQALESFLSERLGSARASEIMAALGNLQEGFTSVLQFYVRSGMSADEFAQIEAELHVASDSPGGRVNVNTAPEAVLACIPGIGPENAPNLVAHRRSLSQERQSMAWVTEVLDPASVEEAGPWLTGQSFQYSIDIVALGHHGRGFRRIRFVCDLADGEPKFVAREDLTSRGWALGVDLLRDYVLERSMARNRITLPYR